MTNIISITTKALKGHWRLVPKSTQPKSYNDKLIAHKKDTRNEKEYSTAEVHSREISKHDGRYDRRAFY